MSDTDGPAADTARCARWLVDIAGDLRSAGDIELLRVSEEGVAPDCISLADELWLVAATLDFDMAMRRAAEIRERNGAS